MYNILTLNEISEKGLSKFQQDEFNVGKEVENPIGIVARSADMHSYEAPDSLIAVARAGAGTNNIPVDKFAEQGIVVFNTPGANANAVKELVITSMLISSRKIVEGIEWTNSLKGQENVSELVEKGKKQFIGPEIKGKRLGVIGLGAIGVLVANAGVALEMEVVGYDPYLSVSNAMYLKGNIEMEENVVDLVSSCDFISIHMPLNDDTRNFFDDILFVNAKKGCRLLNFSRAELVDTKSLKEALETGLIYKYITDFPNDEIMNLDNVITIPHLGASTPESEDNCAEMAAWELKSFIKYGTIKNSVNYPNCDAQFRPGKTRITIAHKSASDAVTNSLAVFSREGLKLDNMVNKSRGDYAYTIFDLETLDGKKDQVLETLGNVDGVIRARLVREC